ncbi:MAG: tRNA lysidine(34) synthetase TilS [Anaerolineaceae bacterium]
MTADKILDSLRKDCAFDPDRRLIVGVSGGADSLTLIHALHDAGLNLIAGHLDHCLRPTSALEAEQVARLMKVWGVLCEVERTDVNLVARTFKLGVEEAARVCRYQFLFRLADKYDAQAVAVAHTADDQVETVLMHFLRGAGINGLKGMQPVSYLKEINPDIPVFRPMLGVFHQEVAAYCREHQLPFVADESNLDPGFLRNRLRLEVVPVLEQINPAFKQVTLRNARALQSDFPLLERLERDAFNACKIPSGKGYILLDLPAFLKLEEGLQRRVLIQSVNQLLPGLRNIGLEQVDRVVAAIRSGQQRSNFLSNIEVWVERDAIQLVLKGSQPDFPDLPQLLREQHYEFDLGRPLKLANGWSLTAELVDSSVYRSTTRADQQDPCQAWLNPADLELPMTVRGMRKGERWAPLGMQGKHQKISDFFINQKIPQGARAKWPLVLSEGSFMWVVGLRIGQAWRVVGDEQMLLHLHLHHPASQGD